MIMVTQSSFKTNETNVTPKYGVGYHQIRINRTVGYARQDARTFHGITHKTGMKQMYVQRSGCM